ncbi:hypothetical protein [Acidovorax sp. NCPPB 4044]|uniref:hypothetical protein n=1 Tax=Acidovorax sp. NCPPB 4044 TaxID=2940490 RepID=UPI002304A98A|nr:hypothetical protein [Acidovorax sp. NCPPB 4044]MDA8522335.1 hypothetical protein [Acidovorax sp. NCPPB 4044]
MHLHHSTPSQRHSLYLVKVPGHKPYTGIYAGSAAAIAHAIEIFGAMGATARPIK